MTQKTISAAQLQALGACLEQVERFHEIFGAGEVVITRELCIHHAQEFDWSWAAMYLLTERGRADYEARHAPLDADYEARHALLDADYEARRALLDADYEARRAPLLADYEARRALRLADYEAKRALLWADCYILE